MNRSNTTTGHGVAVREEVSLLGNGEQATVTDLHGLEGSPNPQPFGTGGRTEPAHPLSLRDMETPVPMEASASQMSIILGKTRHMIWQTAINVGHVTLAGIYMSFRAIMNGVGRMYMPLREARRIWQRMANEVAADCFDANGHVDVEKVRKWMNFLGNAENFKKAPWRFTPHTELMRSQIGYARMPRS